MDDAVGKAVDCIKTCHETICNNSLDHPVSAF